LSIFNIITKTVDNTFRTYGVSGDRYIP